MKEICLVGPVDKRLVAYPLLKILDATGKTLVITDDSNFRRFSEDKSLQFTMGRSDFIITLNPTEIPNDVNIGLYEYIVYVTAYELKQEADKIFYCHNSNMNMTVPNILSVLEDKEYIDVLLSNTKKRVKNGVKLPINDDTMGYVWSCEEAKQFLPCQTRILQKACKYLLKDIVVNANGKVVDFYHILVKKGVI